MEKMDLIESFGVVVTRRMIHAFVVLRGNIDREDALVLSFEEMGRHHISISFVLPMNSFTHPVVIDPLLHVSTGNMAWWVTTVGEGEFSDVVPNNLAGLEILGGDRAIPDVMIR